LDGQEMHGESPRRAEDPRIAAAHDVIDDPAQPAKNVEGQRPGHVGSDETFQPQEVVAGDDLPARRLHVETPVCKNVGFELEGMERQVDRPLPAKPLGLALEQPVIGFRAARVVALDIEDMPPPDQVRSALAS
jgi:hypothetical protein